MDPRFDGQGLVTAVVELNSDFEERSLYFVTDDVREKTFIEMEAGRAIVHRSYALHGVDVSEGTRWTWITWYSDDAECRPEAQLEWHERKAASGNPVSMWMMGMLLATGSACRKRTNLFTARRILGFQTPWKRWAARICWEK